MADHPLASLRAQRFMMWLRGGWIDWDWTDRLPERWVDAASDFLEVHVADRIGRGVCRRFGHIPTIDHCGLPEHDYCDGCNQLTPGMADRTGLPERWEERMGMPYPYVHDGSRWVRRG